jgi:predicted nucleic acid-binding protein
MTRSATSASLTSGSAPRQNALVDTSAAIALLLADHEQHAATRDALRGRRIGLAGHAWFETYSVLTRLPAGKRRSPRDALALLTRNFPDRRFLDPDRVTELGRYLARHAISGGAVYDALVAAAALQHDLPLVTRDRRAVGVYQAMNVRYELLA